MTNNNIHPNTLINETTNQIQNPIADRSKENFYQNDNISISSSNDFDEDEYDEDLLSQIDEEEDLSNNINTIEMKLKKALKRNNPNKANPNKSNYSFHSRRHLKWTKEEDDKLADLVDSTKVGHGRRLV